MQNVTALNKISNERLVIAVGGFGSGKSEYAINLALQWATNPLQKTALVDLDLVNAYFRSRDIHQLLTSHHIRTVIPPENIMFSDLPIAGPGIGALIRDTNYRTIIDVGGDDVGATALGTYLQDIKAVDPLVIMVVNPYRPYTQTVQHISEMKQYIEASSGIRINALVSNPNTGAGTSLKQVLSKHKIVAEAAQHLNLPIKEILVLQELYQSYPDELDSLGIGIRPLQIYLSPQWLLKQQKEDLK